MTSPAELLIDDDAVVWSAQPELLGDRPLVLLLHGRASNERDLFSLVHGLPAQVVYASVRAPLPEGGGWSWFGSGAPGRPDPASVHAATAAVLSWLDRVDPHGPVGVVGFSQGGAMATQLLRQAPDRFAALISLAGFSVDGGGISDEADALLPLLAKPFFWGRDPADPVIPASAIARTIAWLPVHSNLTIREYPGIGHSVSAAELADASAFLSAAFGA